ncbi:MucR family transcriptional regulator [Methylobacterium sp. PvR107]|uniref:MucR family transcriptional regulator n=1 Tax=Methylobacterium sp. PvR107 TaxID=2806597 RepID=UPI001AEA5C3B|nr:MucR family transcriptional regulator [Methylobacterium sp. PvR107]MBP1180012.1 putative transcriptional regulator [Methylobacterium sp. PvR107]
MSEATHHLTPGIDTAIDYTANIVASYVRGNHVAASDLPGLIRSVHGTLVGLVSGATAVPSPESTEKLTPAQIKKSITPDALISFIDGRSYKTLKRHLSAHGLEPRAYRARFGLPDDYPMTAPSYAAQRSALAKSIGLGRPGAMAGRAAA